MEQEYRNIGIAGAGASGCLCAYLLIKSNFDVTLFDYASPLRTILPTGGGRCNLAHCEYDFKELAKNYPRGEKFLYSVFSRFSTKDTINLFKEVGIKTYSQADGRIFPETNSAKYVRDKILDKIKDANFVKEKVLRINVLANGFSVKTTKSEYYFTDLIISTGGGNFIDGIKHNIIPIRPSLVGLNTDIRNLSGIVIKNVYSKDIQQTGDILFTHFGLSGPLTYKISSIKAKDKFPYQLVFNLYPNGIDLQNLLNNNPHKLLKNLLSELFPTRFAEFLADTYGEKKSYEVDGKIRDYIENRISNFKINVSGTTKGEETVTSGGYDLKEINSKTMESKIHPHLFFTGEVLDIDGFCGGFNLQNAWSTAFVASNSIINYTT